MKVSIAVNGVSTEHDVEPRLLLVHYLRDVVGLTGTNVGCDTSSCGACTVHLDGESVKSCTVLAAQADGSRGDDHRGSRRPTASSTRCRRRSRRTTGCSAGSARRGWSWRRCRSSRRARATDEASVREGLEGNLCRCTGYHNIVKAVLAAAGAGRRVMSAGRRHADGPQGGPPPAHRRGPLRRRPRHPRRPLPRAWSAARTRTPASRRSTRAARSRCPGVEAVLTGADLRDAWAAPMPCAWPVTDDMKNPEHFPVAVGEARYAGDIVAVVVADVALRGARRRRRGDRRLRTAACRRRPRRRGSATASSSTTTLGTNASYTWALVPDPPAVEQAFASRRTR